MGISGLSTINGLAIGSLVNGNTFSTLFTSSLNVSTISGDGTNNYLKIFNVSTIQNSANNMGISGLSTINGLAVGSLVNGDTFSTLFTSSLNVSTISGDGTNNFLRIFNVSTIQNSANNMGISGLSTINGIPVLAPPKHYFSTSSMIEESVNYTVVQISGISSIEGGAYQAIGQVNFLGQGRGSTTPSIIGITIDDNGTPVVDPVYVSYPAITPNSVDYNQSATLSYAGVFSATGSATSSITLTLRVDQVGDTISTIGGSLTVITNLT
jgi:hypothetical protein